MVSDDAGGNSESGISRRRAASVAQLDAPPDTNSARPLSQHSKHSRASSDLSLVRGFSNPPISGGQYHGQANRSPRFDYSPGSSANAGTFAGEPVDSGSQTVPSQLRRPGIRLDLATQDSFLDMDESDGESYPHSDDLPLLQRPDEGVNTEAPGAKVAGVSFDELVDRLVAPRMTKTDHSFADIFLCLYRQFASPSKLFSAVLDRLNSVKDNRTAHALTKTATQLRMIEVIAKWVSLYPGDFARPKTRRSLREFVEQLSTEPIFFTSARQIRHHLEHYVVEDDDTWWAVSDEPDDLAPTPPAKDDRSQTLASVSSLRLDDDPMDPDPSKDPAAARARDFGSFGSQSHVQLYEEYEQRASHLEPSAHLPMDKPRYHSFMGIPDEDLAEEMTRMDWVMFSSIRIRDFVRHVGLSAEEKVKCRSLKNVNRMISHFNHVAKWVANMILLRDKAKHRAQTLVKFMNIAMRLRQMNNYNGLAAVLAGINGSAIHRLAQTRALVPLETQKSFARLVILMGTQKSHFAYRLAWENSPLPRIPFVPLHRRDLVSAEEGSRTMVGPDGDRINWKKFEVLGEVLLPIMKSQGTAYAKLKRHIVARELVLDFVMPTDEE
ncbi:related to aimless RasGEF (aleA), partial [Cephalotrichum gorgonifer]